MSPPVAWAALAAAGLLDVAWAMAVKAADGYTRPGWTLASLGLLAAFVFLLGRAMQVLPVGTAYAVWAGIGTLGTFAAGAALFGEPLSPVRIAGAALVLCGIVILKAFPG